MASVASKICLLIKTASVAFGQLFFAVYQTPLEPARFVDDAFEEPGDRVRPERPLRPELAHVREHLLFALGLIDLDPLPPS